MSSIYHLITHNQWEASKHQNTHEADTLATEGFIHCSATVEQLLRVANRLYSDRPDMLALVINTNQLTYQLKEEPSRSGEIYPHIYGPHVGLIGRALQLNGIGIRRAQHVKI